MSELNFRAWDKISKKYCYDGETENGSIIVMHLDGRIESNDPDTYKPTDFIVEQSTGICDVYGVEIFEGDILMDLGAVEYSIFGNGKDTRGHYQQAGFYARSYQTMLLTFISVEFDLVVVGNIHSPEHKGLKGDRLGGHL